VITILSIDLHNTIFLFYSIS